MQLVENVSKCSIDAQMYCSNTHPLNIKQSQTYKSIDSNPILKIGEIDKANSTF